MYNEFVKVFLAETEYMKLGFADLIVEPEGNGVFKFIGIFNDGMVASTKGRADVMASDAYNLRLELMRKLLNLKPATQRAVIENETKDLVVDEPVVEEVVKEKPKKKASKKKK